MSSTIDRREFLKTGLLSGLGAGLPFVHDLQPRSKAQPEAPNVLVFLFDTFSARHLSINGYPRQTMPRLERFLAQSTVFHNHIASSLFTTASTGSFLTSVHPWQHGAFHFGEGTHPYFFERNVFGEFTNQGYHTISYTHNPQAEAIIWKMAASITSHIRPEEHYLLEAPFFMRLTGKDFNASSQAFARSAQGSALNNSLLLSFLLKHQKSWRNPEIEALKGSFPLGLPNLGIDDFIFTLEDVVNWIPTQLTKLDTPFFGYFHFWPPHFPYNTRSEFFNTFAGDEFKPIQKPENLFTQSETPETLLDLRKRYDEYLLYVDAEFDRLLTLLDAEGILDNSYVVLTSDHGEMFERGIKGHGCVPQMHPLLHVPLVIKAPKQAERYDVFEYSSTVDMLPTLLKFAGREAPDWTKGYVLSPYANPSGRSNDKVIFSYNTLQALNDDPFRIRSFAAIKHGYKLIYIAGYEELNGEEHFELYDLENDPEELNDLYGVELEVFEDLYSEILLVIEASKNPGF